MEECLISAFDLHALSWMDFKLVNGVDSVVCKSLRPNQVLLTYQSSKLCECVLTMRWGENKNKFWSDLLTAEHKHQVNSVKFWLLFLSFHLKFANHLMGWKQKAVKLISFFKFVLLRCGAFKKKILRCDILLHLWISRNISYHTALSQIITKILFFILQLILFYQRR